MREVALGIDIGGTNTTLGFVTSRGELVFERTLPTREMRTPEMFVERVHAAIQEALSLHQNEVKLVGIGIGAPNGNYYNGTIEFAPNLKWTGVVHLVDMFKHHYDVPVALTNDANAAAMGEMIYGVAKGMKNFIMITLGTGVGSGIVVNGEMVYGHDGFAGEIGHCIVDVDGRDCGCGRKGCLETYASATGIVRTMVNLLHERETPSLLRDTAPDALTALMVGQAAEKGDALALEAFDFTGRMLGFQLANTVAHTSPEAIILFGGLAQAGDLLLKPVKKYMEAYMLNIFQDKVKLLPSGLPSNHAAILGASALAWKEIQ